MLFSHFTEVPTDSWRWPNFRPDEPNLACPCCGEFWFDPHSMDLIQAARDELGAPMRINSGHRCAIHNARVGGAPLSEHKRIAFDISTQGYDRHTVLEACQRVGFTTFGFYQTFLHTDRRPNRRWYANSHARQLWTS